MSCGPSSVTVLQTQAPPGTLSDRDLAFLSLSFSNGVTGGCVVSSWCGGCVRASGRCGTVADSGAVQGTRQAVPSCRRTERVLAKAGGCVQCLGSRPCHPVPLQGNLPVRTSTPGPGAVEQRAQAPGQGLRLRGRLSTCWVSFLLCPVACCLSLLDGCLISLGPGCSLQQDTGGRHGLGGKERTYWRGKRPRTKGQRRTGV